MSSSEKIKDPPLSPLDKFHEIEIQKVFDAMLSLQNLRVQLGTFFGTANLTALGVAFSVQKVGIVFLAALLFLIFIILDIFARGTLFAYYYRAILLQERFAPIDNDTYLDIFLPVGTEAKIRQITKINKPDVRFKALRRLPITYPAITGFWLPCIGSLLEIGIGLILWFTTGWHLF